MYSSQRMNKKSSYEMMLNRPKHQCSKPDCGSKERFSFASVHDKTERGSSASFRQKLREKNKLKLTRNDYAKISSQKCNPPALTTSASSNFLCQEQQRNLLMSAKAQDVSKPPKRNMRPLTCKQATGPTVVKKHLLFKQPEFAS